MEKVPDKFIDIDKYIKARKIIKKKIPKHSAYRSMQIIRYYKDVLKGRIKNVKDSGLKRWLNEKWISVYPYIKFGQIIPCGSYDVTKSACRPLKRVNEKTPLTIDELIEKHGEKKLLNVVNKKNKDPQNTRLYWSDLRLIKIKK